MPNVTNDAAPLEVETPEAVSAGAGSKLWLDYDQAGLDAAYGPQALAVYAPNQAQVVGRMVASSYRMRARRGPPQAFGYGPSAIERLYFFPAREPDAPIHVHVHGGAWRQRLAETILFPAEAFVDEGVSFAMFDFTATDETDGDLAPMLAQVCNALAWVARNARQLRGDPARLTVSGFSSGAHLASAAMLSDWGRYGFCENPYRAALLFSGVYDLRPLRLAKAFSYLRITDEVEDAMSARRHAHRFNIPTVLACGAQETPELLRHARDFAEALEGAGKPARLLECEGYNHYEMMESFGHPYSPLVRAAVAQALGEGASA